MLLISRQTAEAGRPSSKDGPLSGETAHNLESVRPTLEWSLSAKLKTVNSNRIRAVQSLGYKVQRVNTPAWDKLSVLRSTPMVCDPGGVGLT